MEKTVKFNPKLCVGCEGCFIACGLQHSFMHNINHALQSHVKAVPRIRITIKKDNLFLIKCRNCKKPKCLEVCEPRALQISNGYVQLDEKKCNFCQKCVPICPFNAIIVDEIHKKVHKCDFCLHRDIPACVSACKTGALTLTENS